MWMILIVLLALFSLFGVVQLISNASETAEKEKRNTKTLVLGDDYSARQPGPVRIEQNKGTETVRVYMYSQDSPVWICPNCECENAPEESRCYVCYYKK